MCVCTLSVHHPLTIALSVHPPLTNALPPVYVYLRRRRKFRVTNVPRNLRAPIKMNERGVRQTVLEEGEQLYG
jgi:hypothetical protein